MIVRLEQEKKTAIQEIMENMQKLVADKNDLKAELILQKEENRGKSEMVQNLQKGQENMRKEIEKDLREKILEEAILRQEKEMQLIYQKKEDEMKVTFTEKVSYTLLELFILKLHLCQCMSINRMEMIGMLHGSNFQD